jgi:transposase-like protein
MDYGLSAPQLEVICALSSGATLSAAAEQAGIHRNTILNWRRNSLPFQIALADAQYDRAQLIREKAEALADLAIQTIQDILTDPKASASVRLKAALAILNLSTKPPEPKKQVELQIEQLTVEPPQPATHNPAQPLESEFAEIDAFLCQGYPSPVHNSAQPAPPKTQTLDS